MDNSTYFFDLGMICGRFAHAHNGHVNLINQSMALCKRTLVFVGSAQEKRTLRNPFSVGTRIDVIHAIYPMVPEERLIVAPLDDMTHEYDVSSAWGRYLLDEVDYIMHKRPNLMVYGNDKLWSDWFSEDDLAGCSVHVLTRSTIPISATQVRGMLVLNDEKAWQKAVPDFVHGMYDRLRRELMDVPVYAEIYDEVRRGEMTLEHFLEVYRKYEEADRQAKLASLEK